MGKGNGKATDSEVSTFPPVSELGAFHAAVNDIRDCVGNDHDAVPSALFCVVLRPDGMEQFVLGAPDYAITMIGALELAKIGLMDYIDVE